MDEYNITIKELNKQEQEIMEKIKNMFLSEAYKSNCDVLDLNIIVKDSQIFYNPFIYKYFNKYVAIANGDDMLGR